MDYFNDGDLVRIINPLNNILKNKIGIVQGQYIKVKAHGEDLYIYKVFIKNRIFNLYSFELEEILYTHY